MSAALTAAVVALALLALIWALQRRLMYFPSGYVPPPAALGLERVEEVSFPTSDGLTLHGWFFPSPRAGSLTVIVCNGNAGNRAYRAPLASALRAQGIAVLLFDYRGYGGNAGSPTETGLAADSRAARAYLLGRADVRPSGLVYFGESLGTAVAVELARAHPPAALVLRSPFTSMTDVGRFHYPLLPVGWLLRDRFPSIERIAGVRCPLLVIAGDRDAIVPIDQSRRLYEAAPSPQKQLVVLPGIDHNDEEMFEAGPVVAFLSTLEQR